MKCSECGISLSRGVRFCPNCGNKVSRSKAKKYLPAVAIGAILFALLLFAVNRVYSIRQIQKAWAEYQVVTRAIDEIESNYVNDEGVVVPEQVEKLLKEVSLFAEQLFNDGQITDYSYASGDSCVYMQIDGWLGCLYAPPQKDVLSGSSGESYVYTLEPYAHEFGTNVGYLFNTFHGPDEAADLISSKINNYEFNFNFMTLL